MAQVCFEIGARNLGLRLLLICPVSAQLLRRGQPQPLGMFSFLLFYQQWRLLIEKTFPKQT